jgi:hypothetical protein
MPGPATAVSDRGADGAVAAPAETVGPSSPAPTRTVVPNTAATRANRTKPYEGLPMPNAFLPCCPTSMRPSGHSRADPGLEHLASGITRRSHVAG